jgi:hypothetical protein
LKYNFIPDKSKYYFLFPEYGIGGMQYPERIGGTKAKVVVLFSSLCPIELSLYRSYNNIVIKYF